jgi:hypothetical protein
MVVVEDRPDLDAVRTDCRIIQATNSDQIDSQLAHKPSGDIIDVLADLRLISLFVALNPKRQPPV